MKKTCKRVFIIDDSPVSRGVIKKVIASDPGLTLAGEAQDPYEAKDRLISAKPDVVTVDIQMPKMDGITFLKFLMQQYPLPVVVISGNPNRVFDALDAGAVDFVAKPNIKKPKDLERFMESIAEKLHIASYAKSKRPLRKSGNAPIKGEERPRERVDGQKKEEKREGLLGRVDRTKVSLIALGASTGGTETLLNIIKTFPKTMPPVLIVQHMPPVFTKTYAERLNEHCELTIKEGEDGDLILPGHGYVAPGGKMMTIKRVNNRLQLSCEEREKISGHIPSVDGLFLSIAEQRGVAARSIGVILTGMGFDGAKGLLELKKLGAFTIGQDEKTSVVYGMPRAAASIGALSRQLPVGDIPKAIYDHIYP